MAKGLLLPVQFSFFPQYRVHRPIPKFINIIIPKCIGLTPKLVTIGKNMGVVINIKGAVFIIIPNNKSTIFVASKQYIF